MKKSFLIMVLLCSTVLGTSVAAKTSTCMCDHIHDHTHICVCSDDCPMKPMLLGCDAEFSPCP